MDAQNIVQEINRVKIPVKVIAIDGRSGSGKSTLAEQLSSQLPGSRIVHIDKFDLYEGNFQKVIDEILEPAKSSSQILILEGIFALSKSLLPYYDYKIWIEYPRDAGFKRGVERDIKINGVDNSKKWQDYWLPKEDEYILTENPQSKANIIKGN